MQTWKKNLYIVWVCQFLAMIGMSSIIPFLPLFIRDLGVTDIDQTARWSGLVFAAPFFISFFLTPVWGNLGDKYGRKVMILRAVFGLAAAQVIIGFSQDVTQLFLGRLLQGALSGFLPAAMALVVTNTPEEKTGYALGLLQAATAAGNVLGPLFGGVLSDFIGFRSVFFFVAGLLFITGILIFFFVKEEKKVSLGIRYSLTENLKFLLRTPALRISAFLILLVGLGFSLIRPIFVLYIETFELSTRFLPTISGALYSILAILSSFSAPWWGKRSETLGVRRSLFIASLITGIAYLSHFFVYEIYLLIPIRILLGFGFGALFPLLFTQLSKNISFERKGGVLGIGSSFQILGHMVGPLIGGYITGIFDVRAAFIFAGIIFLIVTFITLKVRD
jgi:MFS transporter, DHA1 family, multidrug resistance protein